MISPIFPFPETVVIRPSARTSLSRGTLAKETTPCVVGEALPLNLNWGVTTLSLSQGTMAVSNIFSPVGLACFPWRSVHFGQMLPTELGARKNDHVVYTLSFVFR